MAVAVEFDQNIPWAAGLFDGEGSTSVLKAHRDKYAYVRMNVTQKFRGVLDKFMSVVNVGNIYKSKTREIHSLDIYKKEDVVATLNLLWPHLSEIKKQQAIAAFERMEAHNKQEAHLEYNEVMNNDRI